MPLCYRGFLRMRSPFFRTTRSPLTLNAQGDIFALLLAANAPCLRWAGRATQVKKEQPRAFSQSQGKIMSWLRGWLCRRCGFASSERRSGASTSHGSRRGKYKTKKDNRPPSLSGLGSAVPLPENEAESVAEQLRNYRVLVKDAFSVERSHF